MECLGSCAPPQGKHIYIEETDCDNSVLCKFVCEYCDYYIVARVFQNQIHGNSVWIKYHYGTVIEKM